MTSSERSAVDQLRSYLAEDWTRWLAEYPELATAFGVPGLNDRWTDDSTEGIERRKRHLSESLSSLRRLDAAGLPPAERVNYELYRELLEAAEVGLSFGFDPLPFHLGMPHSLLVPLNQMEGVHINASEQLEIQPRDHLSDYEDILSRLGGLATAVDQNLVLLEAGRSKGFTPNRVAVRGAPEQVQGLIPTDPMSSPLLRAFADFPARIGEADRRRLSAKAQKV